MLECGGQAPARSRASAVAALALAILVSVVPAAVGVNDEVGLQYINGAEDDAIQQWVDTAMEPRHAVAVLVGNIKSKRGKLYEEIATGGEFNVVLAFGAKEAKGPVSLTVHPFGYPPEVYDGKWTKKAITAWLLKVGYPLVNGVVNRFPPMKFFGQTAFGVVLIALPIEKQTHDMIAILEKFAVMYRDKLKFTFFMRDKGLMKFCDDHGVMSNNEMLLLEEPNTPFRYTHTHKPLGRKYRLEDPTPGSIETFFEAYAAGTLPRYFVAASAVRPAEPVVKGGVRELSGWDYTEVVSDPRRSVLVEYVSDNCTACQDFAPEYAQVARKVQDLASAGAHGFSDVVIARIDHSKNEHTEDVKGTPWLHYWPRGRKTSPVDVESRAADKILSFLEDRVADEIERAEL